MFGEELFLMIHTWNPVDAFISMDAFMYTLLCFGMDAFMYTLLWSDAFIDPIPKKEGLLRKEKLIL